MFSSLAEVSKLLNHQNNLAKTAKLLNLKIDTPIKIQLVRVDGGGGSVDGGG